MFWWCSLFSSTNQKERISSSTHSTKRSDVCHQTFATKLMRWHDDTDVVGRCWCQYFAMSDKLSIQDSRKDTPHFWINHAVFSFHVALVLALWRFVAWHSAEKTGASSSSRATEHSWWGPPCHDFQRCWFWCFVSINTYGKCCWFQGEYIIGSHFVSCQNPFWTGRLNQ